jgi:hypothetical protein
MKFWLNYSKKDRKLLSYLIAFLIILIVMVFACKHRNDVATQSDFEPMDMEYVKACTSKDICVDDVVLLTGQLVRNSKVAIVEKLQNSINRNPKIRTVCFNSPGGDNDSAEAIGKEIALLKLDTCFAGKYLRSNGVVVKNTICNSACPLILLAGQERISYGNALKVGLHSSNGSCRLCGFTLLEYENKEAMESLESLLRSYSAINPMRIAFDSAHLKLLSLSFKVSHKAIGTLDSQRGLDEFHFYTSIVP